MSDINESAEPCEPAFPTRAKDMIGVSRAVIIDLLRTGNTAELRHTWGISKEEAELSLHYAQLAELRVWGIDEMVSASLGWQATNEQNLRRRIAMAMKAESTPEYIHPGDAVLLLERSDLMLVSELREAVVENSTRSYHEDGVDFQLDEWNRLRRLLGMPALTGVEAAAWLSLEDAFHPREKIAAADLLARVADVRAIEATQNTINAHVSAKPGGNHETAPANDMSGASESTEQILGWWDATMDAKFWFGQPSVSPVYAAMLLCQHNPNEETEENALTSTNDLTGPQDYKRLLNAFQALENASPSPRTLLDWRNYARARDLKYHAWIELWVELVLEELSEAIDLSEFRVQSDEEVPQPGGRPTANPLKEAIKAIALELYEAAQKRGWGTDKESIAKALETVCAERGITTALQKKLTSAYMSRHMLTPWDVPRLAEAKRQK